MLDNSWHSQHLITAQPNLATTAVSPFCDALRNSVVAILAFRYSWLLLLLAMMSQRAEEAIAAVATALLSSMFGTDFAVVVAAVAVGVVVGVREMLAETFGQTEFATFALSFHSRLPNCNRTEATLTGFVLWHTSWSIQCKPVPSLDFARNVDYYVDYCCDDLWNCYDSVDVALNVDAELAFYLLVLT